MPTAPPPARSGRGTGVRRRCDGGEHRQLCAKGGRARRSATPAPSCSTRARDPVAARAFREIARLTGGAYLPFDARAAGELARCSARSQPTRPAAARRWRRPGPAPLGASSPTSGMTAPIWAGVALLPFGVVATVLRLRCRPAGRWRRCCWPPRPVWRPAARSRWRCRLRCSGSASGAAAAIPGAPGQSSEVRARVCAMTLDHASGEMDGEVSRGALRGRPAVRPGRRRSRRCSNASRRRATRTACRCSSPGSSARQRRRELPAGSGRARR